MYGGCCVVVQVEKIAEMSDSQSWQGVEIVEDLPGRGRGVKVTRAFVHNEVVCDYRGKLLSNKEGKQKYSHSPEHAMGFMFAFHSRGTAQLIFFFLGFLSFVFVDAVYAK